MSNLKGSITRRIAQVIKKTVERGQKRVKLAEDARESGLIELEAIRDALTLKQQQLDLGSGSECGSSMDVESEARSLQKNSGSDDPIDYTSENEPDFLEEVPNDEEGIELGTKNLPVEEVS